MTSSETVETEVRAWFAAYLDTFASLAAGGGADEESLLDFYGVPLVIVTDDCCSALLDRAAVVGVARSMADGLLRADYAGSTVHHLDVRPLNARAVLVEGVFGRRDRKGVEFERLGVTYLVAKTADGWRFTSMVVSTA